MDLESYTCKCLALLQPVRAWRRITFAFTGIWYSHSGCCCSAASFLCSQLQFKMFSSIDLNHSKPQRICSSDTSKATALSHKVIGLDFTQKKMKDSEIKRSILPPDNCRIRDLACKKRLSCYSRYEFLVWLLLQRVLMGSVHIPYLEAQPNMFRWSLPV